MDQKSEDTSDMTSSSECREIRFDDLMIFYAIIMQMSMKHNPGS